VIRFLAVGLNNSEEKSEKPLCAAKSVGCTRECERENSYRVGGDEISSESIARAIGGKRLLLVLDNCQHLVDAAARLAETVIRLCPAASIVVTSREVLRIEGEHVLLAPVYNRFTEGFETPDLRSASAMLQSFPSHPVKFAT